MKNCEKSADTLRRLIDNIPAHYQGDHSCCHSSSSCHLPHCMPSKEQLSDPRTIQKLTETLHSTYIYRNAQEFCRCRDTFSVESFNHMLLTYVSKRIHFSTRTFNMRMHLAVLDWNENVHRAYTSTHMVADLHRPDRRTAMKVLVDKTYNFVDALWEAYMERNRTDLRPLPDEDDIDQDELFEEGAVVMDVEEDEEEEEDDS